MTKMALRHTSSSTVTWQRQLVSVIWHCDIQVLHVM